MSDYQVIARKFRPQSFKEVLGQDNIVTTLKNAIKFNRIAQAYLFCGSRGTGKTTLARIFAKALNCMQPSPDFEPCNQCSSCREITQGSSMDILEIDGASNRGIEDIRQINDNVGYAASSGGYKIYIIDEVHMLTKEAFNALLKTLEEPPPKVKFFFATTEPHKILPTILSRCQRFNLNRIPLEKIVAKLTAISERLGVEAEPEALRILGLQAEGGLRDAESLLDQILAFEHNKVTASSVNAILGLVSRDVYFELDVAGKEGNLAKAFQVAHDIFSGGKNLAHFVDGLIGHYRNILLIKIGAKEESFSEISVTERKKYEATARLYSQEQCLSVIDYLIQAQNQLRFASSSRIALEAILLYTLRSHFRIPIEVLVRRLSELEHKFTEPDSPEPTPPTSPASVLNTPLPTTSPEKISSQPSYVSVESVSEAKPLASTVSVEEKKQMTSEPAEKKNKEPTAPQFIPEPAAYIPPPLSTHYAHSVSEDPTPSPADLGKKATGSSLKKPTHPPVVTSVKITPPLDLNLVRPIHYYDTLFQFAAVELEGKIQKI
jgi:DNA polymerase-3 subunit gamma/tau